ncbi:MAG: DUF1330 domain-containing protein [Variibacter sp.]|nr:DUF1330 domain-containing protein [Variibacter sp.]
MPAYWLARAKIIDPVAYRTYNEAARQVWHKYPRRILVRGGRYEVLEGETIYERFVVAEYESFELARAYFASPEYQAAAELRRKAGNIHELVIVEGATDGTGSDGG